MLAAQARAIWPQELEILRRYALAGDIRVLDAGCGTGEASARLAEFYPRAHVLGVDVLDGSLDLARRRHAALAPRLAFENRSVFELGLPDHSFDLVVCRHVVHSIPYPDRVYAELARVTKRGGRLHLIPEDYGMLHFERGAVDARDFWHEAPASFGAATGTDLFAGRHAFGLLAGLGLEDITVDYVVVDTLRVPRETFAEILTAWRDGYVEPVAETSRFSCAEVTEHFEQMIATVRDPQKYAVWMVPVVSARVP
jgi:ubiquinone/menaquinone biosynthesis C-methylase UbiE